MCLLFSEQLRNSRNGEEQIAERQERCYSAVPAVTLHRGFEQGTGLERGEEGILAVKSGTFLELILEIITFFLITSYPFKRKLV
jgi:hypothetical protein